MKKSKTYSKHMTMIMVTLALITTMVLSSLLCAFAEETSVSITDLTIGTSVSGEVTTEETSDRYKFSLTAAGKLDVTFTPTLSMPTYTLYDSKGIALDTQTFVGAGAHTYTYYLAEGEYTIAITPCVPSMAAYCGKYAIATKFSSVSTTTGISTSNFSDIAYITAMDFEENYTGFLSTADHIQYFKLTLPGSGRADISVNMTPAKSTLELLNSSGRTLMKESDMTTGEHGFSYDLAEGTYYLKFSSYMDNTTSTVTATGQYLGQFAISTIFSASNETYADSNNTIYSASSMPPMPFGTKIYGQIAINDPVDILPVEMKSSARMKITLTTTMSKAKMTIYNEDEEEVFSEKSVDAGTHSYTVTLPKGICYFKIEPYATGNDLFKYTGNFRLKVNYSPLPVKSMSVTNTKSNTVVVKASKSGTVSGFQIKYKKSGEDAKIVNVPKSYLRLALGEFDKNKTYAFYVRTYYTTNGDTVYSTWTKKTLKITK